MSSIQTAGELRGLASGDGDAPVCQIKPLSDGHTLTTGQPYKVEISSSYCIKPSRQQKASDSQLCIFFSGFDTYRQPTQAEEDHKMLGQTHFVYHTEVGAIQGSTEEGKRESLTRCSSPNTVSVYIWHRPSVFLSFLCFRASIQSLLLLV